MMNMASCICRANAADGMVKKTGVLVLYPVRAAISSAMSTQHMKAMLRRCALDVIQMFLFQIAPVEFMSRYFCTLLLPHISIHECF